MAEVFLFDHRESKWVTLSEKNLEFTKERWWCQPEHLRDESLEIEGSLK